MACAWAVFAGYAVAMLLSYFVGQKKYPIAYDLKGIGKYVALAGVLYVASEYLPFENVWVLLAIRTCQMIVFVAYIVKNDFPLRSLPVIGKYFR